MEAASGAVPRPDATAPSPGTAPTATRAAEAEEVREARYAGELGGTDLSRLLGLSDGIFAFAMTLLVIYLVPPSTIGRLGQDLPLLETYVIGFLVLAVWWSSHHRLFLHIHRWDRGLLWTNLALLMTIAVQPFFIDLWITFPNTTEAGVAYTMLELVTGSLMALVWLHAARARRLLAPGLPETIVAGTTQRVLLAPLVFLVALGVAFVAPRYTVDLFVLLLPAQLIVGRIRRPRRRVAAGATRDRPLA